MTRLAAVPEVKPRAVVYVRVSTKDQLHGEGDPDGYSIPAQRDACLKRAEALGASVAEVFVERGESARSTDRPALQRMLGYLADDSVQYVIVHKVDRLARNRLDDVTLTAQIQASGAQLVSVTENIDETPSGTLLHGIMSSIAEFYSRNLANEVIKGTQQKVSAGGTPHVAPLGYLNVRHVRDGQEVRTIEPDPERAQLVRWAFEAYATGDYSLKMLAAELADRGLTQRPTPKRAARPLPANKLHEILRNPLLHRLRDVARCRVPGEAPGVRGAETFEQVQRVLEGHRVSGERSYRNKHYLSGALRCGRCQSRLLFVVTRGRRGDHYEYFYCAGRHSGRTDCTLPHVPVEQVEQAVEAQWQREAFPPEVAAALSAGLLRDLAAFQADQAEARGQLEQRIAATRRQRLKWSDMAMEGVVPYDIARAKQKQLADDLPSAECALERLSRGQTSQRSGVEALLGLLAHCGEAYLRSDEKGRRDYNQAWFENLDLDVEDDAVQAVGVHRTAPVEALQGLRDLPAATVEQDLKAKHRRGSGLDGASRIAHGDVSNFDVVVELRGFEPLTPSMRTRCATGLRHSPRDGAQSEEDATSRRRPGGARG